MAGNYIAIAWIALLIVFLLQPVARAEQDSLRAKVASKLEATAGTNVTCPTTNKTLLAVESFRKASALAYDCSTKAGIIGMLVKNVTSSGIAQWSSLQSKVNKLANVLFKQASDALDLMSKPPASVLLTLIPPPGSTVAKALVKMLQKLLPVIEKGFKRIGKFASALSTIFSLLKVAGLGMDSMSFAMYSEGAFHSSSASTEQLAWNCALQESSCTAETTLDNLNGPVYAKVNDRSTSQLPQIRRNLDEILSVANIMNTLWADIISKIAEALQPFLDTVQKIVDWVNQLVQQVKDALKEAYCCGTPYGYQVIGNAIEYTYNLVMCPVEGTAQAIGQVLDAALSLVEKLMYNFLNQMLYPVQSRLSRLNNIMPALAFSFGGFDSNTCSLNAPQLYVNGTFKPFETFVQFRFTQDGGDSVSFPTFDDFINDIVSACKSALQNTKKLTSDCCIAYNPLPDGAFCDPTGMIPYKHCTQCISGVNSWWASKVYQACGKDPCWGDSTVCLPGTSCKQCCNGNSFWFSKAAQACGIEPKWADGTVCLPGITCQMCANGNSYWWTDAVQKCGKPPCLTDGTLCLAGTTCNQCCNSGTYWYSKVLWACGKEPCWADGTMCALGTSCSSCCNTATYWGSQLATKCGTQPCLSDGTLCAAGTSCNKCCNSYSYWYGKAFTACGKEPCWGAGTYCFLGTTCKNCCNGSRWVFWDAGEYCQ